MIENRFKRSIAAGTVQIGLWASLADSYAIEIVAAAGFDWLLIDGEHAPNDLRSVLAQLQAVAAYPAHPVVRIPVGDAVLIKQYLDLGVQSLLIPMVETDEQARQLVAATQYSPRGTRGVATARASRWGAVADYFSRAGESICLLLQVETVRGLGNLDEILAVEGVDGVFVGPSDLAASMGRIGQPSHPEVMSAVERAIKKIVASGKAAGILTTDTALARAYIQSGVAFCAVGVDTIMLSQAARMLVRAFKHDMPEKPVLVQRSGQ